MRKRDDKAEQKMQEREAHLQAKMDPMGHLIKFEKKIHSRATVL